jgi:hypothetical protein
MTDLSEAALQRLVIDTARWAGFVHWHCVDSRRSLPGFPDLVLVHVNSGRLVFIELKSQTGRLRTEQLEWMGHLSLRHEFYVWRPSDWESGLIKDVLTHEPEMRAAA